MMTKDVPALARRRERAARPRARPRAGGARLGASRRRRRRERPRGFAIFSPQGVRSEMSAPPLAASGGRRARRALAALRRSEASARSARPAAKAAAAAAAPLVFAPAAMGTPRSPTSAGGSVFARSGRRMGKRGWQAWSPSCATSRARWARRRARAPSRGGAQTVHRACARGGARRLPLRGEQRPGAPRSAPRPGLRVALCGTGCAGAARHRRHGAVGARGGAQQARGGGRSMANERTPSARLASPPAAWRLRSRSATGGRAPRSGGTAELARLAAAGAAANARVSRLTPGAARRPPEARADGCATRGKPKGFRGKPISSPRENLRDAGGFDDRASGNASRPTLKSPPLLC